MRLPVILINKKNQFYVHSVKNLVVGWTYIQELPLYVLMMVIKYWAAFKYYVSMFVSKN